MPSTHPMSASKKHDVWGRGRTSSWSVTRRAGDKALRQRQQKMRIFAEWLLLGTYPALKRERRAYSGEIASCWLLTENTPRCRRGQRHRYYLHKAMTTCLWKCVKYGEGVRIETWSLSRQNAWSMHSSSCFVYINVLRKGKISLATLAFYNII